MTVSVPGVLAVAVLVLAGLAAVDLRRQQESTIVVYTTAALREVLERDLVPRFQNETGERVELVYVAAGEQYNRLRMSGRHPEADLFLHASPLFIEKGYAEGHFDPLPLEEAGDPRHERRDAEGRLIWRAFAWTPVVAVHSPRLARSPDLASPDIEFGIPDPLLSNNGVYAVLYFEALDPEAGARAVERTKVQPSNAAANMGGVTDGSFDVTLGYESVALLYQEKGARIAFDLPRLDGEVRMLSATMAAALVKDHPHAGAERFLRFLFTEESQARLPEHHLRAVRDGYAAPPGALALDGVEPIEVDWSRWSEIEERIPAYQVRR